MYLKRKTNNSKKKEESLEDLVTLLFQQMRDNPPEWTAEENQSEDLKELTRILNVGNENAVSQDSADKRKVYWKMVQPRKIRRKNNFFSC